MSAAYEQAVEFAMRDAHLPRRSSLKQTKKRTASRNNRNRVDFSPDVTTSSDSDPQRSSPDSLSESSYQQYNDAVNATLSKYAHHVRNGTAEVADEKQTAKEFPKETVTGRKYQPHQPRNVHIHQEIRVTTSDYSTEPSNRSSMDFDQSIIAYQEQMQEQQKKLYAQQQQRQMEQQQQQLHKQQLEQKLQQQFQIQQEQQRQQQLEEQERLRQQREQEQRQRQLQQQREKQLHDQMLLQEHKRKAEQQESERRQMQLRQQQQEFERQQMLMKQQQQQQQEQQRRQALSQPSTISIDQLAVRNQPQTFAAVHMPSHSRQSSMKQRTSQNVPPRSTVYAVAMPLEQTIDIGKGNGSKNPYQVHPQQIYAAPGKNDINVNTVSASSGFKLPQYYLANPQSKQETRFQIGKGAKKERESGSMTCCWIVMGGIGLTIALIVIFIAGSQLHIWDGII